MVVALQLQTEQVGLDLPLFFAAINTIYEMEKSISLVPSLSAPQIFIAYSLDGNITMMHSVTSQN